MLTTNSVSFFCSDKTLIPFSFEPFHYIQEFFSLHSTPQSRNSAHAALRIRWCREIQRIWHTPAMERGPFSKLWIKPPAQTVVAEQFRPLLLLSQVSLVWKHDSTLGKSLKLSGIVGISAMQGSALLTYWRGSKFRTLLLLSQVSLVWKHDSTLGKSLKVELLGYQRCKGQPSWRIEEALSFGPCCCSVRSH